MIFFFFFLWRDFTTDNIPPPPPIIPSNFASLNLYCIRLNTFVLFWLLWSCLRLKRSIRLLGHAYNLAALHTNNLYLSTDTLVWSKKHRCVFKAISEKYFYVFSIRYTIFIFSHKKLLQQRVFFYSLHDNAREIMPPKCVLPTIPS